MAKEVIVLKGEPIDVAFEGILLPPCPLKMHLSIPIFVLLSHCGNGTAWWTDTSLFKVLRRRYSECSATQREDTYINPAPHHTWPNTQGPGNSPEDVPERLSEPENREGCFERLSSGHDMAFAHLHGTRTRSSQLRIPAHRGRDSISRPAAIGTWSLVWIGRVSFLWNVAFGRLSVSQWMSPSLWEYGQHEPHSWTKWMND